MIALLLVAPLLLALAFLLAPGHTPTRRRVAAALVGITFCGLLFLGSGPGTRLLIGAVQNVVPENPAAITWAPASAIVVLGVGAQRRADGVAAPNLLAFARLVTARHLYEDCRNAGSLCTIYLSGGDPDQLGRSEAAIYADALSVLGVPRDRLVLESNSRNTWENAMFTTAFLDRDAQQTRILVTSRIHMHRSLLYFAHFGDRPQPYWSDELAAAPTLLPNTLNIAMADIALHESLGVARHSLYSKLGLNDG